MLFSSLTFLFLFLPVLLILYFVIPHKYMRIRNIILLIFSLIFYAWGEPKYIFLMMLTVFISYIFGLLINKSKKRLNKLICLVISIILITSSLIYFKYTNFFIDNINNIFNLNINIKNIVLPIGISFYTFQILTYIIDLYRGKIKVQKNFFNLALYISFFPQLIAGPIVKYETIEDQLTNRKETLDKVISGLERFIIGLSKKVIIANNMAIIADAVYNNSILNNLSWIVLLLGVFAYTFQIYFDFSGYSDMAIGLGKIFGFEFLENFNYPYIAKNITDFWQRWHISLTTFFREYIYIPLGGNRVSKSRWILNMAIVWILTGFWHGAAWTFIIWGIYYLILLLLERTILKKVWDKCPRILGQIITFMLVSIGWIIFRANDLSSLSVIIKNIFTLHQGINLQAFLSINSSVISALPYFILAIIFSINIKEICDKKFKNVRVYNFITKIIVLIILVISIAMLVSSIYNPFIYFRF